jgi:hypothetical protein
MTNFCYPPGEQQAANLCPSGIDDDTLLLIMQLAPISSLPLAGCTSVTDDTLKAAIQLGADIKHANLRRCTITPQGLSVFAKNLPLLQSLDVGMCEVGSQRRTASHF